MRKDSLGARPTLEPTSPAELIASLAKTIKNQDPITRLPGFLTNAYIEWSGALESFGLYKRRKDVIPDIEKQLFTFFCAQLRVEEVDITPVEERKVFTEVMSHFLPLSH